jgi:hypothetical protein
LTALPAPDFGHLRKLTDEKGIWEHAEILTPRTEHGFCTDDNARALLVVCRQPSPSADLDDLAAIYLRFVLDARTESGHFHNRRDAAGIWIDDVGSDDSQGRAWWGLGTVARLGPTESMRRAGADAFATCASFDSPFIRANAYAALGAVEMLMADPDCDAAAQLLRRTSGRIADAARGRIPWPEDRLTYDNARLPEALLAAGTLLGDRSLISTGIRLLEWLVQVETHGDHFSFTPAGGWNPGERRPAFDQQPIEALAMAEACYRAWSITGDAAWKGRAVRAAQWFMGRNDPGMVLYDEATGGTCDGLEERSVNENRGAESTLAGLAALQIAALCSTMDLGAVH